MITQQSQHLQGANIATRLKELFEAIRGNFPSWHPGPARSLRSIGHGAHGSPHRVPIRRRPGE